MTQRSAFIATSETLRATQDAARRLLRTVALTASLLFASTQGLAQDKTEPKPGATDAEQTALSERHTPQGQVIEALPLDELRIFAQVFSSVRAQYVEEVDDATLIEYAIKGILSQLDPHSAYLDAERYENVQEQTTGEFGGLGIEIGQQDGFIKVISPIDETPAAKAGIEAGDLIIKIDGKSAKGLSIGDSVEKLRGEKGSEVTLTILRDGAERPIEISVVRDVVKVRSVRSDLEDGYYGYIRVAQFQLNTDEDVKRAFLELKSKRPDLRGLVLDLRNNPGGVLRSAVNISDLFLDGGKIVYTKGRAPGTQQDFFANAGDIADDLPIVVLINDGSASASEIVAGALQDHNRALIVGTRSFGKGSVQRVIPVAEDRAFKLTTSLYYTPKGTSIQAQGIKPDIEIEQVKVTSVRPRSVITEADLSGHLSNGNGGEDINASDRQASPTDKQNRDSQLFEAINLLKGLSALRNREAQGKTSTAEDTENIASSDTSSQQTP